MKHYRNSNGSAVALGRSAPSGFSECTEEEYKNLKKSFRSSRGDDLDKIVECAKS